MLKSKIRRLPKADLHNHLILGPSIQAIRKCYPNNNLDIPKYYNGLDGMIEYIHKNVNKLMKTKNDVIKFMEIAIEDCIKDNVVLLEASIDIGLISYFSGSIEMLIEATSDLRNKYLGKIDFRPEIGINKNYSLERAYIDAQKCIESGVYKGIDLYGPEKDMQLNGFVDLFLFAKKNGIKTKVHIGEFSEPNTIEEAIDLLDPDEIQHGIKAAYSKKTMSKILEKDIQLNICPQSNLSLGAEKSLALHPIRALYDFGVKITINTDDRILFGASLTDQYVNLIKQKVFSFEEIDTIRKNALKNYNGSPSPSLARAM